MMDERLGELTARMRERATWPVNVRYIRSLVAGQGFPGCH